MRKRLLTDHEKKLMEKYISDDGERDPTLRSIARYAREIDTSEIRKEIALIERFSRVYDHRNG